MKQLLSLLAFLFITTHGYCATPKIFVVDGSGSFVSTNSISGSAPLLVNVSAVLPTQAHPCYWDPTAWHDDGEHDLCDLDKNQLSTKNPTGLTKYFATDSSKLSHPQSVESSNPSACFVPPYDTATTNLISAISGCVRARDLSEFGGLYKQDFKWDFGDAGSAYNSVPGFNAGHLFEKVGKYTVALSGGASLLVNVIPSVRSIVSVNSDADLALLSQTGKSNRQINLKAGAQLHTSGQVQLNSNDFVNGQGATIISTASPVFALHGNQVVVENLTVNALGKTMANANANNEAFKNVRFTVGKGFDASGVGQLFQTCGNSPQGSIWQSNKLNSNWILGSITGASLYGNFGYEAKEDWNAEPAFRFNGGELIALYDNNIGGYCGKQDCLSLRGSKNVYVGSNRIRGGVANVQLGNSQNAQPFDLPVNIVFQGNDFENLNLQVQAGNEGVRYDANVMTIHSSSDPFDLIYPYQNPIGLVVQGGPLWNLTTSDVIVSNSLFTNQNSVKKIYLHDANVKNFSESNNKVIGQ